MRKNDLDTVMVSYFVLRRRMESIAILKGVKGEMELFEDRIVYRVNMIGDHSERTYPINNIQAFQLNKASFLTPGYVRIITGSSNNPANYDGMKLMQDPDTMPFKPKNLEQAIEFQEKVSDVLSKNKSKKD